MSNKLFCILGRFASGKTTIAKILQEQYGYKRVVTCTTRKKREGEREGIDYYFLSDAEFESLDSKNKLAAVNRVLAPKEQLSQNNILKYICSKFANEKKIYLKKYGVPIDKINLEEDNYICVIEPSGYYDLVAKMGSENVKSIYLNLDDKERWLRALNREIHPDINDIVAKHIEELALYDHFEDRCDKVINNAGTSDRAALEILEYIRSFK